MNIDEATYFDTTQLSRPKLERLLKSLELNKYYHRASGNKMWHTDEAGDEIEVSDFIGGYGSALLGHHHPELTALAIDLLTNQTPIHSQLSSKKEVHELAAFLDAELFECTGKHFITTLVNTGAEAVEAALKHARMNFSLQKTKLTERLHRELHIIHHYFDRTQQPFDLVYQGVRYTDFDHYKRACIAAFNAVFEEQSPQMIALKKSFHGKTTGALNMTSNDKFRDGFQTNEREKDHVCFIDPNAPSFEDCMAGLRRSIHFPKLLNGTINHVEVPVLLCLGIIVEPIQGEGGIRPLDPAFIAFLRAQATVLNIPLIFDEIQCGSYRTGEIVYSTQLGITADYYLLSKSFGGGMVKNAAVLIDQKHYIDGFGLVHTSTYSDDSYSAAISLKALQISKQNGERIRERGVAIRMRLEELQRAFPEVVSEIRGTGLMLGIGFHPLELSENYSFQMFARSGYLNYLYCSYLLNRWNLRIAPTLSDPYTLRLLPSVEVSDNELEQLSLALTELCAIIHCRDFYQLIAHLLPTEYRNLRERIDFGRGEIPLHIDPKVQTKVGFITHYINEDGAREGDPSMAVLPNEMINQLLESVLEISAPILLHGREIIGEKGDKTTIFFAGMLFTAAMAREMMSKNQMEVYSKICNDAVDFLHQEYDCSLVGLGQYSSVITKNGLSISNPDVFVTTGNSYTVGIGVKAIREELGDSIGDGKLLTLGVLGAAGNICSTYVKCFLPYFSTILLKGSESDGGKLKTIRFARELTAYCFSLLLDETMATSQFIHPNLIELLTQTATFKKVKAGEIKLNDGRLADYVIEELGDKMPFQVIDNLESLQACKVTVVATNNPEPFLYSRYFSENSIVYDISVPLNCTDELIHNTKNIKVIMGGVVQVPDDQTITMRAYPLDVGEAFACISETMILGLENKMCHFSYGNLHPEQVRMMDELGEKHGFKLKKNKLNTIF